MKPQLDEIKEALSKVEEGIWIAQEDCPNCKGNGFTFYDTEAGYERDECHCLVPENRMFNANAPKCIASLVSQVEESSKQASDFEEMYKQEHREKNRLARQVEAMQQALDTAVMWLQENELFVKAEQLKRMKGDNT